MLEIVRKPLKILSKGEKDMGVYKRKDSSYWWYNFSMNGRRYQISTKIRNKRDNKKIALQEYQLHIDRVLQLGDCTEKTWDDLYDRYYALYKKVDQNNLNILNRYFSRKKLSQLTRDYLNKTVDFYATRRKAATVNRVFNTLRSILNKAYKELGWIPKVPFVKKLKEDDFIATILSCKQEKELLRILPVHTRDIAKFALQTGLRKSAITNLTWDMVQWEQKKLNIPGKFMKNRKAISIPLTKAAWEIIACQPQRGLYPNIFKYRGKPIKNPAGTAWKRALKNLSLNNLRFHDLRHTWATRMMEKNVPEDTISYLGGWSDNQMVSRYSRQRQIDVSYLEEY